MHINCVQVAQNTSLKIIIHKTRLYPSDQLYAGNKILIVKPCIWVYEIYIVSILHLN